MTDTDAGALMPAPKQERLLSLDFFRGFTMLMLVGESARVLSQIADAVPDGSGWARFMAQFEHAAWHGLTSWDLIQPFFMFIVGVALPFSAGKRLARGDSQAAVFGHVLLRSLLLLFLGWYLGCMSSGKITFFFQNVLAQLSFTYLVAFLLMRFPAAVQIAASIFFLVTAELAYRFFPVDGFNEPFTPDKNFGAYLDMWVSGKLSGGHWVSINAWPTAAHTIWGVLAGQLLLSHKSAKQKIGLLLGIGALLLVAGFGLDYFTPIIKRIATSSFVLASGGFALCGLGLSYAIIDVLGLRFWTKPFVIVGMNPLFIYMFCQAGGGNMLRYVTQPIASALKTWKGEAFASITTALIVWFILWYLCYFLYKRKIFLRL